MDGINVRIVVFVSYKILKMIELKLYKEIIEVVSMLVVI